MTKRLTKSSNKMIAGVCGGLANYFAIDPTIVRVVYALLTVSTAFAGVLVYLILMLIIPQD